MSRQRGTVISVLCVLLVLCTGGFVVPPAHAAGPTVTRTGTRTATAIPTTTIPPTATATRIPGSRVPGDIMGLVARDPFFETKDGKPNRVAQDTMGSVMRSMGVRWVRIDMRIAADYWASAATVDAAIGQYDYFIKTVAPRQQLRVLLLVNFDVIMGVDANEISKGPFSPDTRYGPRYNMYMRVWMDRVSRILTRYGKNISAIEILNEANRLPRYSPTGPVGNAVPAEVWAQLTTSVFRACNGGALQIACAGTPVILGGLHPRGTDAQAGSPAVSDIDYLAAVYASNAFKNAKKVLGRWPLDGVGYHPYPVELQYVGVNTMGSAMDRVRARLRTVGDAERPVWITELGYNVGYARQSEQGQADFLAASYRTLAARTFASGKREIAVVFWFKYEDFPPDSGTNAQKWGLVHIPFVDGLCPGGACYRANGLPTVYRLGWYVYRDLSAPR